MAQVVLQHAWEFEIMIRGNVFPKISKKIIKRRCFKVIHSQQIENQHVLEQNTINIFSRSNSFFKFLG